MKNDWRRDFFDLIIIAASLFVAYLPVFLFKYLHHDDVNFFLQGPTFSFYSFFDMNFSAGRFLGAWIFSWIGKTISSFSNVQLLRSVCVLGLILAGMMLSRQLRKYFSSRLQACLLVIMTFTLPAFEILASYAGICFQIIGVLFAIGAATIVLNVPDTEPLGKRLRSFRSLGAVSLLIAAICVYQPTAMFYWACLAPALLFSKEGEQPARNRAIHFYAVGFLGLIVYAATLFLVRPYIEVKASLGYDPFLFSSAISQKVLWFFQEPLLNVLNLWKVYPALSLGLTVAGYFLFSVSFFLYQWLRGAKSINRSRIQALAFRGFGLAFLFPLTVLPSLAWAKDAAFYRCLTGLSFLVLCLLVWVTQRWIEYIFGSKKEKATLVVFIVGAVLGVMFSCVNVYRYVVYPDHVVYQQFRNDFSKIDPGSYDQICFIKPRKEILRNRYDEFGFPVIAESRNDVGLTAAIVMDFLGRWYYPFHIRFDKEQSIVKFYLQSYSDGTPVYFEKRIMSAWEGEPRPSLLSTMEVSFADLYKPGGPLNYLVKN